MKREFLKNLGIEDEAVLKSILDEAGKDLNELKDRHKTELDTANKSLSDLQETVKKFDGVNVDELKTNLSTLQKKYDEDLSNLKLDYALDKVLSNSKAKDTGLVKSLLDKTLIKLDGDNLLGVDDQLKKIRKEKDFLFEPEEDPAKKTTAKVKGAQSHEGGVNLDSDNFITNMRKSAGLKE